MDGRIFPRDRISDLPDSILTTILSLLPAEEVVRTSELSTRWVRLWASVPVLVFDDQNFYKWHLSDEEFIKRDGEFIALVKFVLHYREPLPLDTFKFTWSSKLSCTHPYVFELLCHAVMFKPRVLSININTYDDIFDLPDSIFTRASIEEMSLLVNTTSPCEDHFIQPKSIKLPALYKLELGFLEINDYFMTMLLSGCPALEELVFYGCYLFVHEISSPVLKKLVLKELFHYSEMLISCPGLVSLKIHSNNMGAITLKNMTSLVTADIYFENVDISNSFNHDLKLLGGLSNVTTLGLSTPCLDVLDLLAADIPNCGTLKNLKDLELGELDVNLDWKLVSCFLQHSPNLKKLSLQFGEPSEDDPDHLLDEDPLGDITFQREYLEMVVITCPRGNDELASKVVEMLETLIKIIGTTTF